MIMIITVIINMIMMMRTKVMRGRARVRGEVCSNPRGEEGEETEEESRHEFIFFFFWALYLWYLSIFCKWGRKIFRRIFYLKIWPNLILCNQGGEGKVDQDESSESEDIQGFQMHFLLGNFKCLKKVELKYFIQVSKDTKAREQAAVRGGPCITGIVTFFPGISKSRYCHTFILFVSRYF